jgi:hypothetical protein
LWQSNFEGVALDLTGDWTGEKETDFSVIGLRCQDNRGPPAGLFVPSLRIENQPDRMAVFWNTGHGLPDFFADGRATVGFSMQVRRANLCEKLLEGVRRNWRCFCDKTAFHDRQLDLTVFLQAHLSHKRLWDPEG